MERETSVNCNHIPVPRSRAGSALRPLAIRARGDRAVTCPDIRTFLPGRCIGSGHIYHSATGVSAWLTRSVVHRDAQVLGLARRPSPPHHPKKVHTITAASEMLLASLPFSAPELVPCEDLSCPGEAVVAAYLVNESVQDQSKRTTAHCAKPAQPPARHMNATPQRPSLRAAQQRTLLAERYSATRFPLYTFLHSISVPARWMADRLL